MRGVRDGRGKGWSRGAEKEDGGSGREGGGGAGCSDENAPVRVVGLGDVDGCEDGTCESQWDLRREGWVPFGNPSGHQRRRPGGAEMHDSGAAGRAAAALPAARRGRAPAAAGVCRNRPPSTRLRHVRSRLRACRRPGGGRGRPQPPRRAEMQTCGVDRGRPPPAPAKWGEGRRCAPDGAASGEVAAVEDDSD